MNRKLLILDVVLVAAMVWAGVQFRARWQAAKAREAAILQRKLKPVPAPPFTPLAEPGAVLPSAYTRIAQKMLFDPSRNPEVIIEVPPPPPPKPMPPLPFYYGSMNLGDGLFAIMSLTSGGQKEIRLGESIGEFKLLGVNERDITLEWDGKKIQKRVDELMGHRTAAAEAKPAAVKSSISLAAVPQAPPAPKSAIGPGSDTGRGFKVCDANDNMPNGSVADGYRKVVSSGPFGSTCRWDPVGR